MYKKLFTLSVLLSFLFFSNCNKQPYFPDYSNVKGYVIGKETCSTDESQDYWLVDLSYLSNTPRYGDTLVINGGVYANVVKTKGLADTTKHIGTPISIDFKIITPNKVETTGCTVANPITYSVKEIFIINLFIIR